MAASSATSPSTRGPTSPTPTSSASPSTRAHHGRGIATRALTAALDHLFTEHHAHRVLAECDERNSAVNALFARLGLRHEGTAHEADWFKEEWTTVETWALLDSER